MFKKEFRQLVDSKKLDTTNFEIIKDHQAISFIGGLRDCPNLRDCNNYSGDCSNLEKCGTYSDGSPGSDGAPGQY